MLLAPAENRAAALRDFGFELRHLRYFVAVAETLHFGRAAGALHISQPPLSRQIQDLERQVGEQLIFRSKPVTLTPAGKVFLTESKRILSQVHRSLETVRNATTGEAGRLNIGFSNFLDLCLLPPLRSVLAERYPEAMFTFHGLSAEEQIRLLRTGALDAGLVMLPVENADHIKINQLFRLPAIALLANTHLFATRNQISLRGLAFESVIDVRDDLASHPDNHVSRMARMCGILMDAARHAPNLDVLFEDIRQTGSVAILPSCVCQLAGSDFRCVPIAEREADFTFGVAHYRDRDEMLLNRFLGTAREVSLLRPHLKSDCSPGTLA